MAGARTKTITTTKSRPTAGARHAARARKTLGDGTILAAEDAGLTPLLPQNLVTPSLYGKDWFGHGVNYHEKARDLVGGDDFVGAIHKIKLDYFNDGFRIKGDSGSQAWLKKQAPVFYRLAQDIWTEFIMQDAAIAFWVNPDRVRDGWKQGDPLPAVVILDCEICQYSNQLGHEVLKVKPVRNGQMSEAQRKALGQRWGAAYAEGKTVTIDSRQGEYFKVLTREKLGNGLGVPRLKQIITQISTYDLLQLADWSGAFQSKTLIRQFKKGHLIQSGEQAGKSTHFVTKAQAKNILAAIKNKTGAFDLVSNFDLEIVYSFLSAAFFDVKKYAGVVEQMELWAGPAALMRRGGNVSPNLMDMFRAEGMADRRLVGMFIESILNDPNYCPGDAKSGAAGGDLQVKFNGRTFLNTKMLLEWIRLGVSNGLAAPQTCTEALGLDTEEEGDLMVEAAKKPKRYTPVFEAKQGMSGPGGGVPAVGGRPSDKPGAETPAAAT